MSSLDLEIDGVVLDSERLQRHWFAASRARRRLDAKCRDLLDALRRADHAWRSACGELAALEALTEALENQLSGEDETLAPRTEASRSAMITAA